MNKEALTQLDGFTGTETYYRLMQNAVLTDGVKFLCDNAECFWLAEFIASAQVMPVIKMDDALQGMQFWTLAPHGQGAMLICERDSNDVAYTRYIPHTDFPFDVLPSIRIWVSFTEIDKRRVAVLYLPSEH